jgi:sugar phosphate isomerase/epimerase
MKFSITTYSLNQYLHTGRLTQLSCIEEVCSIGFDAIEFFGVTPQDGLDEIKWAAKLQQKAMECGIFISCYTIGADFLNGSEGSTAGEIARIKQQVNIAAALGVNLMRHDASTGDPPGVNARSFDEVLPILAEACAEITEYARKFGISTMVENHGYFCQDSDRMVKLYNAVNNPNFGLLCDIGNFLCADESPEDACKTVAPYTKYVHAKDFHVLAGTVDPPSEGWFQSRNGINLRGAALGKGNVPVRSCLDILQSAGYNGIVSLEFEGVEDSIDSVKTGLAYLRDWEAGTGK